MKLDSKILITIFLVSFIGNCGFIVAETFVVKKKKNQPINKIKQDYADEVAEMIRMIPHMHKKLAQIQEQLIDELYSLIDNNNKTSKEHLQTHLNKARELKQYFIQEFDQVLPKKTSFLVPPTSLK